MSRPRQFDHAQTIKLKQLERALVAFYADVYRFDASKVIRSMIRQYVRADHQFDTKAFEKFVKDELLPHEHDPDLADEMRTQTKQFLIELPNAKARKTRTR